MHLNHEHAWLTWARLAEYCKPKPLIYMGKHDCCCVHRVGQSRDVLTYVPLPKMSSRAHCVGESWDEFLYVSLSNMTVKALTYWQIIHMDAPSKFKITLRKKQDHIMCAQFVWHSFIHSFLIKHCFWSLPPSFGVLIVELLTCARTRALTDTGITYWVSLLDFDEVHKDSFIKSMVAHNV